MVFEEWTELKLIKASNAFPAEETAWVHGWSLKSVGPRWRREMEPSFSSAWDAIRDKEVQG